MQICSHVSSLPRAAALWGLAALSLLGLSAPRPAAAQRYSFHEITSADLGAPATPINRALGISNDGVVIGTVGVDPNNGTSPTDGYEYDTNTGAATLLNYHAEERGTTFAGISSDGSTVLGFYGPDGAGSFFTDKGGSITALPDPYALTSSDPSTGYASYYGNNNSGTTVGPYSTDGNTTRSFLRSADGTLTTFSDPNENYGYTEADYINASGTVAGYTDGTYTDFTVPNTTDTYLGGLSDNGNFF